MPERRYSFPAQAVRPDGSLEQEGETIDGELRWAAIQVEGSEPAARSGHTATVVTHFKP